MNFGYDGNGDSDLDNQNDNGSGSANDQQKQDLSGQGKQYDANGNLITDLGNQKGNGDDNDNHDKDNHDNNNNGDNNDTIEVNAGEIIQIGDDQYTVAENGDLLDKDGNVFKEAKDVKDFLKDYQDDGDDGGKNNNNNNDGKVIDMKSIQEALGFQFVDDNDKDIEYENNIEGVKTYIKDVIDQQTEEIKEATLNTLFEKYPFAKEIINYYMANGNSLDGWGVEVDRSNVTIDENNERQQEDIVRTAWKEQRRTGDLDNYIAYLKSSGTLLSTAKSELAGLQQADRARKEDLERQAQAAHQAQEEEMNKFWNGVETAIKSRKLGQYQIPEQIKITRNGKSMMVTPADFYRYVSVTDKDGKTAYAKDCEAVSKEQQINDSLLKAYLMFTGGDYSSLVDMAIKEKEVKTLKLKAKDGKQASRRLTPKGKDNKSNQNMDFGF